MSFKYESRFRERLTPSPPNKRVKAGRYRKISLPTGAVISDVNVNVDCAISSNMEVERTWDRVNPGPPFISGGTFTNVKAKIPSFDVKGSGYYQIGPPQFGVPNQRWEYTGGFTNPMFANTDNATLANYDGIGTNPGDQILIPPMQTQCSEVISKLRPHLEKAGLAVALAEARDVPRMLKTTANGFHGLWQSIGGSSSAPVMQPKWAADQFLNQQFGWVPFLKDLRQFDDVFQNFLKYRDEVTRRNGTWERRVRTFAHTETEIKLRSDDQPRVEPWSFDYEIFCTPRVISGSNVYGQSSIRERISSREWATGWFKYYRPEFDRSLPDYESSWNNIQQQMILYGARINPSNVWKATPWTWLIDWASNVGDVIDNANAMAFDAMVSQYVYLMRDRVREVIFNTTIFFTKGPLTLEWSRFSEIKGRIPADNPFNFCLPWSGLTARQLAILGALGISRRG